MNERARLLFGALFCATAIPLAAFASSTLSFSPASGAYHVDDTIPVRVVAASPDPLAAVDAQLTFDPKLLEVSIKEASKDVSWVVTPTVDPAGSVRYSGMVKQGVTGAINLLALDLKTLRPGKPELHFASGASTIAADGSGGNTLGKVTDASFDVTPLGSSSSTDQAVAQLSGGQVLGASDTAMVVTSKDIPDPTAWYAFKDATFDWTLPPGVANVRIGLSKKEQDVGFKSISGTTTRLVTGIDDGEWFFHVTPDGSDLKHSAHLRVAVDHEAPTFSTSSEVARTDSHDPNVSMYVVATDTVSGVDHYEFIIDGGAPTRWIDDGSHTYHFASPVVGDHDMTIAAFDKAANRSEVHVHYTVTPLDKPKVTLARDNVPEASPIVAHIEGVPGATARVEFTGGAVHHTDTIQLDTNGKGDYKLDESIVPDNYMLSVIQTLPNGATSKDPVNVPVKVAPSLIGYMGRNPALTIALIPIILGIVVFFSWRKFGRKDEREGEDDESPLALPSPGRGPLTPQRNHLVRPVQTAPMEIRRVVKTLPPQGGVVDLRKK